MANNKKRFECICKRCGWKWLSKKKYPTCCAKCKNPYWNQEPIRNKKTEAVCVKETTSAPQEYLDES
jgi:hypothetical protein